MKKNLILVICIVIAPVLSSCWDLTEIEEVGFLMAVGLDPIEEEEVKMKRYEREFGKEIVDSKKKRAQMFNVTFNIAIPSKLSVQDGGGGEKSFFNITSSGITNFSTVRQIASRRSRRVDFEHLKEIIINEKLVMESPILDQIVDFYVRDHEMRRRANVYISKGDAKEILEVKLPLEEMISKSIFSINENYPAVASMISPMTIGEITTNIAEKHSFLIPRIVSRENDLIISGAAVILGMDDKMLGWLGEEDIAGYNIVCNDADKAIIEVVYEELEDEIFVFEIAKMKTTIVYEHKNEKDIFKVEVRAEGTLGESWLHDVEISDEAVLKDLEGKVAKEIERKVRNIIEKMQNEFHADIFGFYNKVRRKNYAYWKTVKENWDGENGVFKDALIEVHADVRIRHYMLNERID